MAPVWAKLVQLALLAGMFWFLWQMLRVGFQILNDSAGRSPRGTQFDETGPSTGQVLGGVLVDHEGSQGKVLPNYRMYFTGDVITVGRGRENDVIIDDQFVSHLHARLVRKEGRYYLEDAGSTNHTYVNGERVTAPRKLEDGDVITMGDTHLRFSYRVFDSA